MCSPQYLLSLPSSSLPSFFSVLFHVSIDSVGVCHVLEAQFTCSISQPFFIVIFVDISKRSQSTHHIRNFRLASEKPYMLLSSTSRRSFLHNTTNITGFMKDCEQDILFLFLSPRMQVCYLERHFIALYCVYIILIGSTHITWYIK